MDLSNEIKENGWRFVRGEGAKHFIYLRFEGDPDDIDYGYGRIRATRDTIHVDRIDNAYVQGVQHLKDLRYIEKEFGLPGTIDYQHRYYDYESYVVFFE